MNTNRIFSQLLLLLTVLATDANVAGAEADYGPDALGVSGTPLTPFGSIRAASSDGAIPQWDGGMTTPPAGYVDGGPLIDPYEHEQPLFTITGTNYQQYIDKLTDAHLEMFKRYPDTYKMNVYPSHRTMAFEPYLYEGTIANAKTVKKISDRGIDPTTFKPGIPFPLAKTGWEVMANKLFSHFGLSSTWAFSTVATNKDGTFFSRQAVEISAFPGLLKSSEKPSSSYFNNTLWCRSQYTTYPPREVGTVYGGCNYINDFSFSAYIYLPGQRRVRRAPELGNNDAPAQGSDGLMTADALNGMTLSGPEERYKYEILAKSVEKIIPYNNYQISKPDIPLEKIIVKSHPQHINQELPRYELHRVWVIEAKVRDGYRHLLDRRILWVDEDSWNAGAAIHFDKQGNVWKVSDHLLSFFYGGKGMRSWGETFYDVQVERYVLNLVSNDIPKDLPSRYPSFSKPIDYLTFTPEGLRQRGLR